MPPEPMNFPPGTLAGVATADSLPPKTAPDPAEFCAAPDTQGHGGVCGAVRSAHDYLSHDFVHEIERETELADSLPADKAQRAEREAQGFAEDGRLYGPSDTLTLSTGPTLVRLTDDCVVAPEAVAALVERAYRVDGVERHATDIHLHAVRSVLSVDIRLADVLEMLSPTGGA